MTNEMRRRRLQLVMDMMRSRRAAEAPPTPRGSEPSRARTWTLGEADPDFDHLTRRRIRDALTDTRLIEAFERSFGRRDADYDEIVRELGYVWECARDGTVNVTGFCCATCSARYAEVNR